MVSTFEANGRTFLQVVPEVQRLLTAEAMHDIAHYLRPTHLQQLRKTMGGHPRDTPNSPLPSTTLNREGPFFYLTT